MDNTGWLKVMRRAPDSTSGRRGAVYLGVMTWLLCRAEWQDDGHGVAAGEVRATQAEMARQLRLTRHQLRGVLDTLEADGFIARRLFGEGPRSGSVVALANYDRYQHGDERPIGGAKEAQKEAQKAAKSFGAANDTDEESYTDIIDAMRPKVRPNAGPIGGAREAQTEAARAIDIDTDILPYNAPARARNTEEIASNAPPAVPAGEDGGESGDGPQTRGNGPSRPNLAMATESQLARFPGFRPAVAYPTTPKEVVDAAAARGTLMPLAEAEAFLDHFQGRGWVDAQGQPMVDWRCYTRRWMRRAEQQQQEASNGRCSGSMGRARSGDYSGGRFEPRFGGYGKGADLDALFGPRGDGASGAG